MKFSVYSICMWCSKYVDGHFLNYQYHFPNFILPTCPPSGAHTQLNLSSKPTLAGLDELIVQAITDGWEQVVLHLGVESFVIDTVKRDNPGPSEEVCREVLNRWLSAEPGTGEAERTWGSVLEALETSGHRQLAEQLRREQYGESSIFCIGWFVAPHSLKQSGVWCPLTVILGFFRLVRTCCMNILTGLTIIYAT